MTALRGLRELESMTSFHEDTISGCFAQQVSKDFLRDVKTVDQYNHWVSLRFRYRLLALLWQAQRTEEGDPLKPLLKNKCITRDAYKMTWLLFGVYQDFWNLCQLCYDDVESEFNKANFVFPFQSPFELFTHLAADWAEAEFLECLIPYFKFSVNDLKKGINRKRGSKIQLERLEGWVFVLAVCASKSKSQPVKRYWEAFQDALDNYQSFLKNAAHHRGFSYERQNGKLLKGKRGGSYG